MDSGAYGIDLRTNLVSLMEAIARDDSDERPSREFLVRLGMINPDHAKRMLPGILGALAQPRFYKFLHVPVQTGSEKVCREMNRDHSVSDFTEIAAAVREKMPDATIATDIIVGYPTETEDDFRATLRLLQDTKPETINLSKFSPRPGTKAKEMKQLPGPEIKRRSEEAAALIRKIGEARRKRFAGRACRVLITEKDRDFKGRDINYNQVVVKGFRGKLGDFADVVITDANHGSLFAKPLDG
jgi:tRNA A37 methylthiotransferase MiaB